MNRRMPGNIRRGLRYGESGQAFSELVVSLLAILAAFIGFLLVAALSSDRVSTLIRAREEADLKSSSGVSSVGGESIRYWDYGPDGIPFTTDDHAELGSHGDGAFFKNQLTDNSRMVSLQNPPSSSPLAGDFSTLQDSNFFVNAASLAKGSVRASDSMRSHNISSLEPAVLWFFRFNGSLIEETVYMPAHKSLEERGD